MITINLALIGKFILTYLCVFVISLIVAFIMGLIMKVLYSFVSWNAYELKWELFDVRMCISLGFMISIVAIICMYIKGLV